MGTLRLIRLSSGSQHQYFRVSRIPYSGGVPSLLWKRHRRGGRTDQLRLFVSPWYVQLHCAAWLMYKALFRVIAASTDIERAFSCEGETVTKVGMHCRTKLLVQQLY